MIRKEGCGHDIHLVIWFSGVFALLSLVSAVALIAVSVVSGKSLDNAILIALLVQPMGVALSNMINLVTQSNSAAPPAGTASDPMVTTVSQPKDDPIPVMESKGD